MQLKVGEDLLVHGINPEWLSGFIRCYSLMLATWFGSGRLTPTIEAVMTEGCIHVYYVFDKADETLGNMYVFTWSDDNG